MAILDLKNIYQEHWTNLDAAAKKKTVTTIIVVSLMVFGAAVIFSKIRLKKQRK